MTPQSYSSSAAEKHPPLSRKQNIRAKTIVTRLTFGSQRTIRTHKHTIFQKLTSGLLRQSGGQWGYYIVQPHTMDAAPGPYKINASFEALSRNCAVESAHCLL